MPALILTVDANPLYEKKARRLDKKFPIKTYVDVRHLTQSQQQTVLSALTGVVVDPMEDRSIRLKVGYESMVAFDTDREQLERLLFPDAGVKVDVGIFANPIDLYGKQESTEHALSRLRQAERPELLAEVGAQMMIGTAAMAADKD